MLSQGGDANKADTAALRTVLSVTSLKRRPRGHLVTEMRDLDNQGLVEIVGRGMVETLVGHDIIGRLMVKCARQVHWCIASVFVCRTQQPDTLVG